MEFGIEKPALLIMKSGKGQNCQIKKNQKAQRKRNLLLELG